MILGRDADSYRDGFVGADQSRGPLWERRERRVLIVDDEPAAAEAFVRCLRSMDAEITMAFTPSEGLRLIREGRYQVVVADYRMPDMDGARFLEKVHLINPDIVRIVVSGAADFDSIVHVINRVGVFAFLPKPWVTHELRSIISNALERYAVSQLNRLLNAQLAARCGELSELNRNLEATIGERSASLLIGLMNALDLRDTESQWHARRVALYSRNLSEMLGLRGGELLAVERGALLHDIGKIGVADAILNKRGPLSSVERCAMECHAEYGYRILAGIGFLDRAKCLVWQHHERWDGSGYPRNLGGVDIDLGARVFAVVDTYDAMTNHRPYRRATTHEQACAEINRLKGILFDPEVVDAWNRVKKPTIDEWHRTLPRDGEGPQEWGAPFGASEANHGG